MWNIVRKSAIIALCVVIIGNLVTGCGLRERHEERLEQERDALTVPIEIQSESGKLNPEASETASQNPKEKIYSANDTFQAKDPENENLAGMLQEHASGVVVRIKTDRLIGSGIIWTMNSDYITVITAAHVLDGADLLEITFIDGVSIRDNEAHSWKWSCCEDTDLAFIQIPISEVSDETLEECRYVAVDTEIFDGMTAGDRILVIGSTDAVAANAYEGTLTEAWIYMEDYQQYMMLGKTYAKPGMSGGGVFNQQGYFVGILSGADEDGNLAVVPLSLIWAEEMF